VISLIIFARKTPERLNYYEVMMRRGQNPNDYTKLYTQVKVGYYGELRLDREWKDANIGGLLFHDFTCYNLAGYTHKMDTIFVCNHFVLVAEVKNVTGRIEFNPQTRQLIRYRENGAAEAFNSPIDQVKRHQQLLQNHFMSLPDYVPVEAAVVITNPSCLISGASRDGDIPIFAVTGLRSILAEIEKRHQHITVNMKQVRASLEKLYRPLAAQPWRNNEPVRTGVLCLTCNGKMRPTTNGFKCLNCNFLDAKHSAVRRTLHDYRVLFGQEISNRQFREFAEVGSPDTAYKILSRLLLTRKGSKRNATYLIPEDIYQQTN